MSLIEVLVTMALVSFAFALIYALAQSQARMARQQETLERFLVDADAALNLMESDLATAFAVEVGAPDPLLTIGHLARQSAPEEGVAPFNSEPIPVAAASPLPPEPRGLPLRTVYNLEGDRLQRLSAMMLPPGDPISNLPVLDGLNSASAELNGPRLTVRLTLLSEGRPHTLMRVIFCPGLVAP